MQFSNCYFSLSWPGCCPDQLAVGTCTSEWKFKYSQFDIGVMKWLRYFFGHSSYRLFLLALFTCISLTPILDSYFFHNPQTLSRYMTHAKVWTKTQRSPLTLWSTSKRNNSEAHYTPLAHFTVLNTLLPGCLLLLHHSATEIINKYDSHDGLQANQTAQQRVQFITVNPWLLPGFQRANRSTGMMDNQREKVLLQ